MVYEIFIRDFKEFQSCLMERGVCKEGGRLRKGSSKKKEGHSKEYRSFRVNLLKRIGFEKVSGKLMRIAKGLQGPFRKF